MTDDTLPQLLSATQKSDDGDFLRVRAETTLNRLMDFPAAHRVKRHSTNGLEHLNKEVKCRADVVGVRRCARTDGACASLPNEASIIRLLGAVLMEANDEWQLQHRYLSIEAFAGVSDVEEEDDRFALAPPPATPILTPRAA